MEVFEAGTWLPEAWKTLLSDEAPSQKETFSHWKLVHVADFCEETFTIFI